MRILFALAAAIAIAAPAMAQTVAAAPKEGATIRDAANVRLGKIDRVYPDGSVQLIYRSKFVTIPADKVMMAQDGVMTSLTRQEVSKLN
ncbi:hypothetical protein [Sphingobium cupriresistens]|uniref:hypothetical protein n=1 Tax=Sphingobium cupriresistens TaxID=1132417 RepID=UPI003BF6144B